MKDFAFEEVVQKSKANYEILKELEESFKN